MNGDSIIPASELSRDLPRNYGMSLEAESSAEDFLSEMHRWFYPGPFIEKQRARESVEMTD